ncbi:MAG: tetratricopeptide repeat protein, partial [Gemmatimonadaceae bacterium]
RDATKRAFQLNPSLGKAHANLSLERFDAQSYARAREVREARGLSSAMEISEDGTLAHFNLGLAFRQKGYLAEALREYRLAIDRGEDRTLVLQAMAEVHLLRKESDAAVQLYDRLLKDSPQSPKLWNERGVALHQEGKYADARESYMHALESDNHYALVRNNLAVAYFHDGRGDLALNELREALSSEPGFLKGRLNLALLLFRQGAHASALDAYHHTLRLSPDHAVAWNGVGLVLVQLQRIEEARNAFARAIEARSDFAEAHYNLGFALSTLGDYAGSLRETKRALELDPYYSPQRFELAVDLEFEDPRFEVPIDFGGDRREQTMEGFAFEERSLDALFGHVGAAPAEAHPSSISQGDAVDPYAIARELSSRGAWEEARAFVREQMDGGASQSEGLVALGETFLSQGVAGEAVERFREATRSAPGLRSAIEGELRALVRLRRYAEAPDLAEVVLGWSSCQPETLLLAGLVYAHLQHYERAREARERLRAHPSRSASLLQSIGDLSLAIGDEAAAIDAYHDAVALDSGFAAVRVQLAGLLRHHGRLEQGEAELVAALRAVPTFVDAALALAAVRRELGRPAEGIDALIIILEGNPYHLDALASLGESLFLAGRADDARFALARVLRFDPQHVAALYFDGVFLAQGRQYAAAIERWREVIDVEPAGDFGRRARRDWRTATDAIALESSDVATRGDG